MYKKWDNLYTFMTKALIIFKVMEAWMGSGKSANIRCLDLDRSDLHKYV